MNLYSVESTDTIPQIQQYFYATVVSHLRDFVF